MPGPHMQSLTFLLPTADDATHDVQVLPVVPVQTHDAVLTHSKHVAPE